MITVSKGTTAYEISAQTRPPSIYLDHWALRRFSSDLQLRNRFINFFRDHGTLLFSLANMMEIAANTGESLRNIQNFLCEIGEQWFPLEVNPIKVIKREAGAFPDSPCFDKDLLEAYYPHIHEGSLSLSTLIDLISDQEVKRDILMNVEAMTTSVARHLELTRSKIQSDPIAKKAAFKKVSFDAYRPETFVYRSLLQLIFKENSKIETNDVLDLCHAAVSLAYGDFVLLDPHWADLARRLKVPPGFIRLYSPRQIQDFIKSLEQISLATP